MFTITGWKPRANYARLTPALDDALGCLQGAEQQGFLGVEVWNESRRIVTLPEIHRNALYRSMSRTKRDHDDERLRVPDVGADRPG
jgi:hypothetical protein